MKPGLTSVFLFLFSTFVFGQSLIVRDISILGRDRTKEDIILRELPFQKNDTVRFDELIPLSEMAQVSLNNTLLFNKVEVYFAISEDSAFVDWQILLQERWHLFVNANGSIAENNVNTFFRTLDLNRINVGADVVVNGLTGQRDNLTLALQIGWTTQVGLKYDLPGINKKKTIGLGAELYFSNNQEVNFASDNNERLFFRGEEALQQEIRSVANFHWRPKLFDSFKLSMGYHGVFVNDTVKILNTNYLENNQSMNRYLLVRIGYRREKRDNRSYPLKGYLVDANALHRGLGIIESNGLALGEAFLTANHHSHLKGRFYFAHGVKAKWTFLGDPPYFFQRGLGYESELIRGYELSVIDGQHYGLYKSNLKFNLVKQREIKLKTERFEKFNTIPYSVFLNLFADGGYVIDNINTAENLLANQLNYSLGLGLDFVSYYDLVIRFEASLNAQGQPGFFVHFKNPI